MKPNCFSNRKSQTLVSKTGGNSGSGFNQANCPNQTTLNSVEEMHLASLSSQRREPVRRLGDVSQHYSQNKRDRSLECAAVTNQSVLSNTQQPHVQSESHVDLNGSGNQLNYSYPSVTTTVHDQTIDDSLNYTMCDYSDESGMDFVELGESCTETWNKLNFAVVPQLFGTFQPVCSEMNRCRCNECLYFHSRNHVCAQSRGVGFSHPGTSRDCLFRHSDANRFGVPAGFGDAGPFRNFFSQIEHSTHPPHAKRPLCSGKERYFIKNDDEISLPGPSYRYDDQMRLMANARPRNPKCPRYEDDTDSDDNY